MTTEEPFGRYVVSEVRFMQVTFRNIVTAYGEKYRLKAVHLHVLGILLPDEGQTLKQLRERTHMTSSNLSPVCTLLEERGLIKRTPHDTDGRSSFLYLTEEGVEILDGLDEWLNQILSTAGPANAPLHEDIRKGFQAFHALVESVREKGDQE